MRVLMAEDDAALAKFVSQGLEAEHYTVDIYSDGEQARTAAHEIDYDLVILDLNLPKLDGVSVLRQLRAKKPTLPVLVLTQRSRVEDRVQCLDTGADDYLAKPFSYAVLVARLRALLRRGARPRPTVLGVGDLRLDPAARDVWLGGVQIALTPREFAILEYFLHRPGEVLSKKDILDHIWDFDFDGDPNIIEVYVRRLRTKLHRSEDRPVIETLRGAGYRLVTDRG